MQKQLLVAGGGIGGLAAAMAAGRAGWSVRVFERANAFSEIGAGLQLGPNATRILQSWGLGDSLEAHAAFPSRLAVRSALHGGELAGLRLGAEMQRRYGAPYATLHRADLHALLLDAGLAGGVVLLAGSEVQGFAQAPDAISAQTVSGDAFNAEALVAADGLWSRLRADVLNDGAPQPSGYFAYRALAAQSDLPSTLRSNELTAWLGPNLHVVCYPVRRGELLNVVAFARGEVNLRGENLQDWDQAAVASELHDALVGVCGSLRNLISAMPSWRRWVVSDRAPMRDARDMARGRVALLGDAAHPMLPYLAQGAGMALEDAGVLGDVLAGCSGAESVPAALRRYAELRWRRVARVQARARRNGQIFHMTGMPRIARDASMRLLGERLLDMPWLYGMQV